MSFLNKKRGTQGGYRPDQLGIGNTFILSRNQNDHRFILKFLACSERE